MGGAEATAGIGVAIERPRLGGSWFDALLRLADRLPWPRVVSAVVASVVIAVPLYVSAYVDSPSTFGIRADLLVGAATLPLLIWIPLALNDVALRSLVRLRPALDPAGMPEAEIAAELLRTPNSFALLAIVLGVVDGAASVFQSPGNWGLDPNHPGIGLAAALGLSIVTEVVLIGLLAHVLHQLRVVSRVHRSSVRIDVFHLEPLYAFSTLTAATGIALIAMVIGLTAALSATTGSFLITGASDIAITAAIVAVAIASFVLPLLGLHGRIADAKDAQVAEARASVATLVEEVRARVVAGELEGAGRLKDAMSAAESSVSAVSHISTWPWRPETFRGFVSAIGLPIIVWTITQVLLRLLPRP
jgi:hypothetical protein